MAVVDLLTHAPAEPAALALLGAGRGWSVRQLADAVDARAEQLRAAGCREGEVAPVVLEPDAEGVVTLLAHWRLGVTPAPLHPRLTEPERNAARAALAAAPAGAQAILWTSGTAGRPRGVALSFDALAASARAAAERLELREDDVWLASLSPAHVGGLALIVRALLLGAPLLAGGTFDASTAAALLAGGAAGVAVPVTHVSLVPTQLLRVLDLLGESPPHGSFRCALVGGAHAPGELVARALGSGWPLALTYGLTEASSQVATAPPALVRRKPGTVGPPLAGVELRLADDEILVRGATLATGYVGAAEALVDAEGWHRTGDVGHVDGDGDLWVRGRRVERIVTGGTTVDALEVEEVLRAHPHAADACVVGVPDREWGERVAAWLVPAEGADPDPAAVGAFARARLAGAKRPRLFHVAPELPRNRNGKVDREAVRAAFSAPGAARSPGARGR